MKNKNIKLCNTHEILLLVSKCIPWCYRSGRTPWEYSGWRQGTSEGAHGTEHRRLVTRTSEEIMPSASSQSSMQITAQMENNDLTKSVLSLLEKKVRNLEKRKVRFRSNRSAIVVGLFDHAIMKIFVFFKRPKRYPFLFAGKAWWLQEAGRRWTIIEWWSKGAFIKSEF